MTNKYSEDEINKKAKKYMESLNNIFMDTYISKYKINNNMIEYYEKGKKTFEYTVDEIMENRI